MHQRGVVIKAPVAAGGSVGFRARVEGGYGGGAGKSLLLALLTRHRLAARPEVQD
jgi:hypothetical protein